MGASGDILPAEGRGLQIVHGHLIGRLLHGRSGSPEGIRGLGIAAELVEGDSTPVVRLVPGRLQRHSCVCVRKGFGKLFQARARCRAVAPQSRRVIESESERVLRSGLSILFAGECCISSLA